MHTSLRTNWAWLLDNPLLLRGLKSGQKRASLGRSLQYNGNGPGSGVLSRFYLSAHTVLRERDRDRNFRPNLVFNFNVTCYKRTYLPIKTVLLLRT